MTVADVVDRPDRGAECEHHGRADDRSADSGGQRGDGDPGEDRGDRYELDQVVRPVGAAAGDTREAACEPPRQRGDDHAIIADAQQPKGDKQHRGREARREGR
jgi:hypothetical protein